MHKASLAEKFAFVDEPWRPKVVARLNGQELKPVRLEGVFPWHRHDEADELFLVWRGAMAVEFRDGRVELGPGDPPVVPRGVEHRTSSEHGAEALIFEPADTSNTGDVFDPVFTAPIGDSV